MHSAGLSWNRRCTPARRRRASCGQPLRGAVQGPPPAPRLPPGTAAPSWHPAQGSVDHHLADSNYLNQAWEWDECTLWKTPELHPSHPLRHLHHQCSVQFHMYAHKQQYHSAASIQAPYLVQDGYLSGNPGGVLGN
jgi:hypothetical protein